MNSPTLSIRDRARRDLLSHVDWLAQAIAPGARLVKRDEQLEVLAAIRCGIDENIFEVGAPAVQPREHLIFFGPRCFAISIPASEAAGDLRIHAAAMSKIVSAATRGAAMVARMEDQGDPAGLIENVICGVEFLACTVSILNAEADARDLARSQPESAQ